ncbi:hypothetical protein [Glycomyces sp. NPDC048151]|uniref:hypothetical protein n=1 Tax=Glycomyces sp. NPDC048151 TaxID=3364002 RepID=UPI00371EE4CE
MIALAGNAIRDSALLRRARRDAAIAARPAAFAPAPPSEREPRSVIAKAKHAIGDSALLRRSRGKAVNAAVPPAPLTDPAGSSLAAKAKHAIGDSALLRRVRRRAATDPVAVVPVQTVERRERLEPSEPQPETTTRRGLLRLRPRFVRAPREAAAAERVPVRYRVARAVGSAASALPRSRAVRVGTAVAVVVAENQGILRAGLTAASAVPVLRPYVKVAVAATSAISVAHRVIRAKDKAAGVVSAFRAPAADAGTANAGNGFALGSTPPAGGRGEPDPARFANPAAYRPRPARPTPVPVQANDGANPEDLAAR